MKRITKCEMCKGTKYWFIMLQFKDFDGSNVVYIAMCENQEDAEKLFNYCNDVTMKYQDLTITQDANKLIINDKEFITTNLITEE